MLQVAARALMVLQVVLQVAARAMMWPPRQCLLQLSRSAASSSWCIWHMWQTIITCGVLNGLFSHTEIHRHVCGLHGLQVVASPRVLHHSNRSLAQHCDYASKLAFNRDVCTCVQNKAWQTELFAWTFVAQCCLPLFANCGWSTAGAVCCSSTAAQLCMHRRLLQ